MPVEENMSNKRSYKDHVDEFHGSERESAPHRHNKRARREIDSSSSASDTLQTESDLKRSSVGGKKIIKRTRYSGHASKEIEFSNSRIILNATPKKDINAANKSRSPGYHQFKKPSTLVKESTVLKADKSWHIKKSDSPSTLSRVSSFQNSPSRTSFNVSETSSLTSPKTWPAKVKVNSAERRLEQLQQSLRRNQESPSCSSSYRKDQLVHGWNEVPHKTNSESASKAVKVAKSSVNVTGDSLQPKKSAKKRVYDNFLVKPPEKHHTDVPYLSNLKETNEKESLWKQASCSSTPSRLPNSNLAAKRLDRIQQQLRQQRASTSATQGPAVPKILIAPVQPRNAGLTEFSESPSIVWKEESRQALRFGGSATPVGLSQETNNDCEEKMDWEPTDHQLNSMILDIHKVRTGFQGRDLIPRHSTSNFEKCASKKSNYFIVLDSNILMGHLKLVEALRDRQFPVLEPLVLILPWMVIQELDKLKDWRVNGNNDGRSAMAATLARTAVKWINLQLQGKHPRVKGQTSFNRTGPMLECSVADDSILACCKEMEPFAANVVLLTEDVNLSNKALMLDIQVLSQSQLKARLHKVAKQLLTYPSTSPSKMVEDIESGRPLNVLTENVISSEESEKSDMILCEVKIHVRNYLEEMAQIKMEEAYGTTWIVDLKISLPWLGLNEVVQFIIKRWRSVFGFACHDRSKLLKFQELLAFLQDKKAYNHSLKEIHHFIGTCIDIVNLMPIKRNCPLLDGCVKSLKQLQDQCKNLPEKPLSVTELEAEKLLIEKPLERIFSDLRGFCCISCEFLKIKHDIQAPIEPLNRPPGINLEMIRAGSNHISTPLNGLIYCFKKLLEIPADQLTTDNTTLQNLHRILTKLSLDYFGDEQYPSINSLAMCCANESWRIKIGASIEEFWYLNSYLQRINAF